jgi:hypothetical protein
MTRFGLTILGKATMKNTYVCRPVFLKYALFLAVAVVAGTAFGLSPSPDPEALKSFFSEASQSQIAQAGFFFTMAAWLHAGQVKKEIRKNFEALTTSIDKVADAFREDLKAQGERLDNLALRVHNLEEKQPV